MKINFAEKTFAFKLLIIMDRWLNVMTGGSFQECLSTRAYINAETAKPLYRRERWVKIRNAINWLFWEGHCKDSFNWEVRLKRDFISKYSALIK